MLPSRNRNSNGEDLARVQRREGVGGGGGEQPGLTGRAAFGHPALSQSLIRSPTERHGGRVTIDSTLGDGAAVIIPFHIASLDTIR